MFFGYDRRHSVTMMLMDLRVPTLSTILHNAAFKFLYLSVCLCFFCSSLMQIRTLYYVIICFITATTSATTDCASVTAAVPFSC